MWFLQWLLGGMDFPATTPHLLHPEPGLRRFFLWKDLGAFYPVLLGLIVLLPLQTARSLRFAEEDREQGLILTPSWVSHSGWARHSARWLPWAVGALMVVVLLFHLDFFRTDVFWFVEHHNYVIVGHIIFQHLWPVVIGVMSIFQLVWSRDPAGSEPKRRLS